MIFLLIVKEGNMSKRQFFLILAISLFGGVMGGFLSGKVLVDKQAFAQSRNKQRIIAANEFRVLDEEGNIQAELRGTSDHAYLRFIKIDKELLVKYGVSSNSPLPAALYEEISNIKIVGKKIVKPDSIRPYTILNASSLFIQGENYCSNLDATGFTYSDQKVGCFFIPLVKIGMDTWTFEGGKYPVIQLADGNKNRRLTIGLRDSGVPFITLKDEKGRFRIGFGLRESEEPYMALKDERGKSRAVLGHITLTDKTGSTIIRPPSSLVLFDEDGSVKWSVP
jgi:hypothetical protein